MKRILKELRDWLEYLIIPSVAVILPWPITVRFFWLIARLPFLYRQQTLHCLAGAKNLNLVPQNDEKKWLLNCKINVMVDLADIFLLMTRSNNFWKKYIIDEVTPLLKERQIVFFPHYGSGMWIYRILANQNIPIRAIGNPIKKGLSAIELNLRLRVWILMRHNAKQVLPGNLISIRNMLKNKVALLVSPDMPKNEYNRAYAIKTDLGKINILSSFFKLSESQSIPAIAAVFSLDPKTGKRYFYAQELSADKAYDKAEAFAKITADAIIAKPYLWRMMALAPEVITK